MLHDDADEADNDNIMTEDDASGIAKGDLQCDAYWIHLEKHETDKNSLVNGQAVEP